jgi:hypothetical protein
VEVWALALGAFYRADNLEEEEVVAEGTGV